MVRLNSRQGWCGNSIEPGGNWVMIDLKAPTVIRGFRTQSTPRPDGTLAFTSAIRIQVKRNYVLFFICVNKLWNPFYLSV